jgi:hypothetical protein
MIERLAIALLLILSAIECFASETYSSYAACKRAGESDWRCDRLPGGRYGSSVASVAGPTPTQPVQSSGASPMLPRDVSAGELSQRLTSADMARRAEASGYVLGLNGSASCVPPQVPSHEIVRLVTVGLTGIRYRQNEPAARIVREILVLSWPCEVGAADYAEDDIAASAAEAKAEVAVREARDAIKNEKPSRTKTSESKSKPSNAEERRTSPF